ncbi:MAG: glycosyltransferase family 9 protein [Deferribacteraceae bacterium]|jgi:ADP-heptose:LPS heptosyltransferase|nr:glycosyltransferase family 9 protein [Deferribacteraceae bacterium]
MMKILLTQLRRIGDVITTTPAVRAIRFVWKDAKIDYLTEPPSDEIFRASPYVDTIITVKRRPSAAEYIRLVKTLRKNRYDVVIDFFCNPTSAYLTWLSGAKCRIGFDIHYRKYFYTHKINKDLFPSHIYAGIHKMALAAHIGVMPNGFEPEFPINAENQREADDFLVSLGVGADDMLVTLGLTTRHGFRQWPLERFAAVADDLISRFNVKILFIYGPGEEDYPRKVQSLMKYTALPEYAHSTISRMRGIFTRTVLHIGCDNGPGNIAKASGIPSVILYSNTRASSWTPPADQMPYENSRKYISLDIELECKNRCLHEKCNDPVCITGISAGAVIKAVEKVLIDRKL